MFIHVQATNTHSCEVTLTNVDILHMVLLVLLVPYS